MVVGADHTRPRSAPSARSCSRSGVGQRARPLLLAQRELGLGFGEFLQSAFPVALQAAGDKAVLGLDLVVAALGLLGLVAGVLELQAPLLQRGVVVVLERFGCRERGLHAGRGERREERAGDGLVDLQRHRRACTSCRVRRRGCSRGSGSWGVAARACLGSGPSVCVRSGRRPRCPAAARRLRGPRRRARARAGGCCRRSARGCSRTWPCR